MNSKCVQEYVLVFSYLEIFFKTMSNMVMNLELVNGFTYIPSWHDLGGFYPSI